MNRLFSLLLGIVLYFTMATHAAPILERRQFRELYPSSDLYLRALDSLIYLSRRTNKEFVGWHGTNIETAELWEKEGKIVKPKGVGESGSGKHLGPGLYVTDDWVTANVFANWNAHSTKKKEKVCAIYAKDSANWRIMMTKVWMPGNLIGDHVSEAERQKYIQSRTGKRDTTAIKFGPLDPKKSGPNQLVIPDHLADHFEVHCVGVGTNPPAGIPTIHYDHEPAWQIHH
ncbi:hypothetical protein FOMPIDRAFT_1026306 [Fomitopsis schrenkii]|uniref:PARP catalytic domain-containing protein n=1 Tax=Fomitopsis schrenkii TaxID=2126942 RepID=S8DND6_FOMSC|nr:hypothetical protein FOMPIDRAFT_1026306 [Fomitopsis schrenkii]